MMLRRAGPVAPTMVLLARYCQARRMAEAPAWSNYPVLRQRLALLRSLPALQAQSAALQPVRRLALVLPAAALPAVLMWRAPLPVSAPGRRALMRSFRPLLKVQERMRALSHCPVLVERFAVTPNRQALQA